MKILKLLTCIFLFVHETTKAQDISFFTPALTKNAYGGVRIGDVNNDGVTDIITPMFNNTINISIGKGNGIFDNSFFLTGANNEVLVQDMNGDQLQDIVALSYTQQQIYIWKSLGNGSFETPVILTTDEFLDPLNISDYPGALNIADFNMDKKPDITVNHKGNPSMFIYFADAGFTYGPPKSINIPSIANYQIGDVDGDTYPDIIYPSGYQLRYLKNKKDSTFEAPKIITLPQFYFVKKFRISDINKDSKLDYLVLYNDYDQKLTMFLSNSLGGFDSVYSFKSSVEVLEIGLELIDEDLEKDLYILSKESANLLQGSPTGVFKEMNKYIPPSYLRNLVAVNFSDLDRNGKMDLVAQSFYPEGVNLFMGQGNGNFVSSILEHGTHNVDGPFYIHADDLNEDGLADVVATASGSKKVSTFLSNGDGTFKTNSFISPQKGPAGIATADMDGDDKKDLILASYYGINIVGIFKGNGDGTFQQMRDTFNYGAEDVKVADFNHDNRLDLVLNNAQGPEMIVMINQGDLHFEVSIITTSFWNTNDIAVADFNRDGHMDIIAMSVSSSKDNCIIYTGNGDGTFMKQKRYSVINRPIDVEVADLDKDGHQDLVFGFDGSQDTGIMMGVSDTSFTPIKNYNGMSNGGGIAVKDFNMDGILDIVAGMSLLLGNGDGTFKEKVDFLNRINSMQLATGDFDGDKKVDIVTVNMDASITLFKNFSTGQLSTVIQEDSNVKEENTIIVYPVPSNAFVEVNSHFPILEINLFNSFGQNILETYNKRFDISSYPSGIYFLRIKTTAGFQTKHLEKY